MYYMLKIEEMKWLILSHQSNVNFHILTCPFHILAFMIIIYGLH